MRGHVCSEACGDEHIAPVDLGFVDPVLEFIDPTAG